MVFLRGWRQQQHEARLEVTRQGERSVQVSISARHGHLSTTTQDKVTEKVEKLQKFYDRLTGVQITVDLEHHESVHVEVRVSAKHNAEFVASEKAAELFAALDIVLHRLEQQLRKYKERIQTGHRQPGRKQLEVPLEPEAENE